MEQVAQKRIPDMRQGIAVQPGSQQQIPCLLSGHGHLITNGRLEERLKLGLVCRRDERQTDVWDLVGGLPLGSSARGLALSAAGLKGGGHGAEAGRLGRHGLRRRRRDGRRALGGRRGEAVLRLQLGRLGRLLLLLLVELLLVLLRHLRHRWNAGLEALLWLSLAGKAGELRLEALLHSGLEAQLLLLLGHAGHLGLHHALLAGETGVLLGQRCLAEARRLRSKRAGLLSRLLLRLLAHAEGGAILLLLGAGAQAVAAHKGVGVGVHDGRRTRCTPGDKKGRQAGESRVERRGSSMEIKTEGRESYASVPVRCENAGDEAAGLDKEWLGSISRRMYVKLGNGKREWPPTWSGPLPPTPTPFLASLGEWR